MGRKVVQGGAGETGPTVVTCTQWRENSTSGGMQGILGDAVTSSGCRQGILGDLVTSSGQRQGILGDVVTIGIIPLQ